MIVSKFGGTSVGSYEAMSRSAGIIADNSQRRWVVISATAGTTNDLVALSKQTSQRSEVERLLQLIEERHQDIASQCTNASGALQQVNDLMIRLRDHVQVDTKDAQWVDSLLAFGEDFSTRLFKYVLEEHGVLVRLEWAGQWIKTDSRFGNAEVQLERIQPEIHSFITAHDLESSEEVVLTQGFIGADEQDRITTLGRGGSDYSAALFAEALGAECLEIWTDVAGVYTTDPRMVANAHPLSEIGFDEAAELSVFGGKVLHPATTKPVRRANIPLKVLSSIHPSLPGTQILTNPMERPIVRAISVRKEQTLMTLHSLDMLHQPGFLAKIFSILAEHRISVDLVTTSEVSVSLTLDTAHKASNRVEVSEGVLRALNDFCDVEIEYDLALVALIGNAMNQTSGISGKLFSTLKDYNIRMVCHGASANNVCFLVKESEAEAVAKTIHDQFIL